MRTTIDLPEELIGDVMALSKTRKKKDAVRLALEEFVRRRKIEKLLALPGKIEISDVTAELERMELDESAGAD
ncbi:MAG: type II toxin-antitoxin system VapB family antitoxin [Chloroflexi bacterium]|nr:type II toxin-antitoxin system VapB family antitoxin [Chloroflexota bacterium]